jgi:hypothetical protein
MNQIILLRYCDDAALSKMYFNELDVSVVPDILVELGNDEPFGGMNSKSM